VNTAAEAVEYGSMLSGQIGLAHVDDIATGCVPVRAVLRPQAQ
jgi:hypothetical protein